MNMKPYTKKWNKSTQVSHSCVFEPILADWRIESCVTHIDNSQVTVHLTLEQRENNNQRTADWVHCTQLRQNRFFFHFFFWIIHMSSKLDHIIKSVQNFIYQLKYLKLEWKLSTMYSFRCSNVKVFFSRSIFS